jgi:glycosyltransferase involved in cell wall biosynthesis
VARSICFYTDSRIVGGAERAMFMLLGSLDRAEWEPALLLDEAPGTEDLAARAAQLGVPVEFVPPMPLGLGGLRRVPAFVRLLRRRRPDVFHAHLSWPLAAKYALLAAVLARVPAVVATVQLIPEFEPSRSSALQLRFLSRRVDRWIAVSRAIADELADRFRFPPEKIDVVYNAVDAGRFDAPGAGSPPEIGADGRPLVLSVARLDEQKGHSVLLAAAVEIPEAVFLMAGDGPLRTELEDEAKRLGVADRAKFLGNREDIPALLAASDVFVLPSLYEGSSLAVLEAMASRRAVVSSAIPGTDELIEDGETGMLVPPGDSAALAAALRRLLSDAKLRESLGERARDGVAVRFAPAETARLVTQAYEAALGSEVPVRSLPERRRSAVLRRRDWQFLLNNFGIDGPGEVVECGFPTERRLRGALQALDPGGEVVCRWRVPRPGGTGRAAARLRAAGFRDVRVYWTGPVPWCRPHFWLPIESAVAVRHLLATRPGNSLTDRIQRRVWRVVARLGLLAPCYALAAAPGAPPDRSASAPDPIAEALPPSAPVTLLTWGKSSLNKVVGLVFGEDASAPEVVFKAARIPEAAEGLNQEALVLEALENERPHVDGVPRLRALGTRGGMTALVETAVEGPSLVEKLSRGKLEQQSVAVTDLLVGLALPPVPHPSADWRSDLIGGPLRRFERDFGAAVAPGVVQALGEELEQIGDVPMAFEHRDCAPWNVVLLEDETLALHDWESAEPHGLPALDLVYFLANAAFVLDDARDSGRTLKTYRALLDPETEYGRIAADCLAVYAIRVGIRAADIPRLRMLCWTIHCRSERRWLDMEGKGGDPDALRGGVYIGLLMEELRRIA